MNAPPLPSRGERRRSRRALTLLLAAISLVAATAAQATGGDVVAIDLGGLETRTAALMLSAQEAGDLSVSILAIPLPRPETATSRVLLVVDLGGASLLEGATGEELITEIYAYAVDAQGGLATTLTRAFRLPLATHRETLRRGGVKFLGHLDLPPGTYSLRTLALHRASGRMGLRVAALTVPPWSDEARPVLLPPFRHEPAAGWITVIEEGEPPPPFPVSIDGASVLPATGRQIDSGSKTGSKTGYLLAGRPLSGLRAHLLDADMEELLELGLGDLRPTSGAPTGVEMLAAELATTDLAAGEYHLRISSAGGGEAVTPLIVRPAPGTEPLVSAESDRLRKARAFPRSARLGTVLPRVREAYHATVTALVSGDRGAALRPLIEIENSQLGSGSTKEQKVLAEAELKIARQLAQADVESLVPLLHLHEQLYRQYHLRHRFLMATHSRATIANISQLYLSRNKTPEAAQLVACAYVSMAGYLHTSGAQLSAQELYQSALEYDPDHPAALIGLATIQESYADYESVVKLLQRLLRAAPEDQQARLRLAINLRRKGTSNRATELLQGLLAAPVHDWIAVVATQELASLLIEQGEIEAARKTLEVAVERHPEVQRLRLQLAALLDRSGRPAEARAALERLDPLAGSERISPRMRYASVPTRALLQARRHFAEQAEQRLPLLAAPLARAAHPPETAGSR